jgi:hypothetical protein
MQNRAEYLSGKKPVFLWFFRAHKNWVRTTLIQIQNRAEYLSIIK